MKEIKKDSWHFKMLENHRPQQFTDTPKWYWDSIKTCGQYRWLVVKYLILEILFYLYWICAIGLLVFISYDIFGLILTTSLALAIASVVVFFVNFGRIKKKIISFCDEPIKFEE